MSGFSRLPSKCGGQRPEQAINSVRKRASVRCEQKAVVLGYVRLFDAVLQLCLQADFRY